MTQQILDQLLAPFIANGLIGVIAVLNGYLAWHMYRSRENDRKEIEVKLAAKDALILQLYDKRVEEGKVLIGVVQKNDMVIETFSRAANARTPA